MQINLVDDYFKLKKQLDEAENINGKQKNEIFNLKNEIVALKNRMEEAEREKELLVYDSSMHHYETEAPVWTEITPGHYILANQEEIKAYKEKINAGVGK